MFMKDLLLDISLHTFLIGWLLLFASALMSQIVPNKFKERSFVATTGIITAVVGALIAVVVYFIYY